VSRSRRDTSGAYTGLHVLLDDDPRWTRDPVEQASSAVAGGAPVVQLRAKHATDRETLVWGREIRKIAHAKGTRFVMNDRFDLALACEADAVHLGQDDLSPRDLPPSAREHLAIGRSTHDIEQARRAVGEGIDYLAYGPLFGTTSKPSPYDARGLAALREISALAGALPVVAIGGIGLDNLEATVAAGARGVAVISAVLAAPDPQRATRALVDHGAWSQAAAPFAPEANA